MLPLSAKSGFWSREGLDLRMRRRRGRSLRWMARRRRMEGSIILGGKRGWGGWWVVWWSLSVDLGRCGEMEVQRGVLSGTCINIILRERYKFKRQMIDKMMLELLIV